jgi:GNAT superfamily N-acetyltransferase
MIVTKRTNATDADFQALVAQLDKELWQRYPLTQQNFSPHNKLDMSARVLVAYKDGMPVGCGCFKPTGDRDTVEIKRMFTLSNARGMGIAKRILLELEKWAAEEKFSQSKLETGINQPEAIAVYRKLDYKPIPNYPPYENNPESICMRKAI